MARKKLQGRTDRAWDIAHRQHGVVTRAQLLDIGFSSEAIEHRIAKGRLHRLWRGVYVVGRPEASQEGWWMAAVLSCGSKALLSHRSAAALWRLTDRTKRKGIDVVVPTGIYRKRPGIRLHRRKDLHAGQGRTVTGIPVTDPVSTIVDLASAAPDWEVERAINSADRLGLVDPEALRTEIKSLPRRRGIARLRRLLGGDPLTDSGLERRFRAIVRRAGLSMPETQVRVNGYRVDFFWPRLGLVVETDGWVYHRTPGEQALDRRRDQKHTVSGLTTLRFSEDQIRHEAAEVERTLVAVVTRLVRDSPDSVR
jgi:very-short-patch-repair endonuclease